MCVNVCYQPLRGKYNKIYVSCELDRCESCLRFLTSIAQKFRIKFFYSLTFLVLVKKKQNAFQKICSVKERHNNYHFPPFLSFSKRHSIQVQKTSLCILSNNCIQLFMMLFQNCLTSRLFPISKSSRSG